MGTSKRSSVPKAMVMSIPDSSSSTRHALDPGVGVDLAAAGQHAEDGAHRVGVEGQRSQPPGADREVVFFAIGFAATAPSTALTLRRAKREGLKNFTVFCNHVTIVPPARALLDSPDLRLDAFIGPGHVFDGHRLPAV